MIKAILFDFNGVIIDDETIQMKAYQEVLRDHEIALTEELYFGALGMDDKTFVRSIFEIAKKPLTDPVLENVLGAKTDKHRQMIQDELPFFPGVLTFLKARRTPSPTRAPSCPSASPRWTSPHARTGRSRSR